MKIMKKICILLMSLCLIVPCFSMISYAADGRISFTDPNTAVGEMVEIKCVVKSTSGNLGNVEVKLSYDSESLRFDSGEGVTADADGALTCKGTGGSAEATFNLSFQALKEGTTDIQITDATIASGSGSTYTLDKGSSKVTIATGDPSKIQQTSNATTNADDVKVKVGETEYSLTDGFKDSDIPAGYTKTSVAFEGKDRQMAASESGAVTLGYLVDAEGKGEFFLFNSDDASFSPYEEVAISDSVSIIPLSDTAKVKLPSDYQDVTLTLNGKDYPVWQDAANEGFYVLYAINSSGEKGLYSYDSKEDTYQRFTAPDAGSEKKDTSSVGKLKTFISEHLQLLVIIIGAAALVVLVLLIVLAVKLHNRNAELDDLYDEYGIDFDEEQEQLPINAKKSSKPAVRTPAKKGKYEEDFDEEDFDEEDFEVYNDEDLEEDYEADYEDEYDSYDSEEDSFDQDGDIDDLDELLGEKKRRGHIEEDDTFKVDFIDLD